MMTYRHWIHFPKLKFVNIGISSKLRHFFFRALIIHHVTVFDKYHSRSCQHTHILDVMKLRIVIISFKMEGKENLDVGYAEWYFWEFERKAECGFFVKKNGSQRMMEWFMDATKARHQGGHCRLSGSVWALDLIG